MGAVLISWTTGSLNSHPMPNTASMLHPSRRNWLRSEEICELASPLQAVFIVETLREKAYPELLVQMVFSTF